MEYRLSGGTWADCSGTTVTGLAAGSYEVCYKATSSAFASEATSVTIASGMARTYTLTVTAPTFAAVTYGYTQPEAASITIESSGNSDATITGVTVSSANFTISGSGSTVTAGGTNTGYTIRPITGLAADTYTAIITVTYTGGAEATDTVSFTVGKAAPSVTAPEAQTLTYTGSAQELVSAGSTIGGTMYYSLDNSDWSTEVPTGTDAGTYAVYYKVVGNDNYNDVAAGTSISVTIDKVTLIPSISGTTVKTYDGTTAASGLTIELSGAVNNESPTATAASYTYNSANVSEATTITAAGIALGAEWQTNYQLSADTVTTGGTINKKEVTATVTSEDKTYDSTNTATVSAAVSEGIIDGDSISISGLTGTFAQSGVGTGISVTVETASATVSSDNCENYTISYNTTGITASITKATPAAVTFPTAGSITYGATLASSELTGGSGDGEFAWTDSTIVPTVTNTGYSVTFTPNDVDNYDYSNVTLTQTVDIMVAKAPSSVDTTPTANTLTYTGSAQSLVTAGTATGGTLVYCLTADGEYSETIPTGTTAGAYTVYYKVVGDENHSDTEAASVSVTIAKAVLTITADSQSIYVGGALPTEYTYTVAGWVDDDADNAETLLGGVSFSCTDANSTAAETYAITATGPVEIDNYIITYVTGTLTVTSRESVTEIHELTEVPSGLKDIYSTMDELKADLLTKVMAANTSITSANTAVYDVKLMVSFDGGQTWVEADEEHFPADGKLSVTLEYPNGTDSSYTFTVIHMFTSSAFGKTPGDTETPTVTNTANGIQFDVTGLSPIAVGWTAPASSGGSGSGGSGSATRAITVEDTDNGTVTSDRTGAAGGTTVTLTVTPDEGYELASLTVTSGGEEITVTKVSDTEYTFTMPSSRVTVEVTFTEISDTHDNCSSEHFTDVDTEAWYHEYIDYVVDNGLMTGTSATTFEPGTATTRGMIATILHRLEGEPTAGTVHSFGDVASASYYEQSIAWAEENGIVQGYGDGTFRPDDAITREQLAAILYRYAQYKGYNVSIGEDTNILSYNDAAEISEYAVPALQWAVGAGLIEGTDTATLSPQQSATRAQVAAILMRFIESVSAG